MRNMPTSFPLQAYRNRDTTYFLLEESTFQTMNKQGTAVLLMTCGCLDALEQIPAGSMEAVRGYTYMTTTNRDQE